MTGRISRRLSLGAIGVALLGSVAVVTAARLQTGTAGNSDETVRSVRKALQRLPYYGVFDFIVFRVNRGVVTLGGYAYEGTLKANAERAVKMASGVDEVADKIEVLPSSNEDDRIRWATFARIYTDDFLSRYAPGGAFGALQDIREEQRFPGMEPVANYPIHIIVKNGRTMLLGRVDNSSDRQIAEVRAREVTGVFGVDNGLTLPNKE